ncbi:MAG TPA: DUF881 domain-containing protein [Nocardioides sp.]|nr:DUF881 domain-containing protein [Nocardioides sp.]
MPDPGVPEERPSGRQQLLTALRRPGRRQVVVALLLALVGFAGVTQVRSNDVDDTFAGLREQDLIDILNGLAGTTQRAQTEIGRLERTRDDLLSDTDQREAALEQAQSEANTLSILAGLVPVTGPGIRVTVTEVSDQVKLDTLLDTVQELRTSDAEAMQINGEVRVVAQTSFEDTEGGFLVDGKLVEPPYVIDVIGEPDALDEALTFGLGPAYQVKEDGGEMEVDQLRSLDIESVVDPRGTEFAAPQ